MEISARSVMVAASFAALVSALVGSSGLTSYESSQVLLAFGAIVALTLTRVPRR
jgi:hypothetical protein